MLKTIHSYSDHPTALWRFLNSTMPTTRYELIEQIERYLDRLIEDPSGVNYEVKYTGLGEITISTDSFHTALLFYGVGANPRVRDTWHTVDGSKYEWKDGKVVKSWYLKSDMLLRYEKKVKETLGD